MAPLLTEEESALDPYFVLELAVGATEKEIKKAYRQLSLRYHPDKNQTPEAVVKFRQIQLSNEILNDAAKRTYVDTKLEADRRRKEKYAASDKRKQEMIDALVQREEAAKKARVDAGKRRQQAAAEEEIKEAGKRMLEEAQKKAAAALSSATAAAAAGPSRPPQATNGHSNGERSSRPTPTITPLDLTLILQFPPASNPEQKTLQHSLSRAYGPIAHVFIKDPVPAPAEPEGKKKKPKPKGRRAIVEFQEGNWGGCWSCWRDVDVGDQHGRVEGLEGVKVKWAAGRTPDWVEWATAQAQRPDRVVGQEREPQLDPRGGSAVRAEVQVDPVAGAGAGAGTRTTLPSFDSAPDFAKSTMADLLASHNRSRDDEVSKKRKEQEFESMTLLKMRQMERDRLAEQIRREEEEEGLA